MSKHFVFAAFTILASALTTITNSQAVEGIPSNTRDYGSIAQRNAFGLQPITRETVKPQIASAEEIVLTGIAGMTDNRRALFMLVTAGKPTDFFSLAEKDQNDWLTVNSVDFESATATVVMKRPTKNAPNAGTTTLSFPKKRTDIQPETKLPVMVQ